MIDKGQWQEFGQDTGVTPLLFTRSAMGFLMTTESHYVKVTMKYSVGREHTLGGTSAGYVVIH